VIDPKIVQSADDRSQFMSTCRQARRIEHINVARVLDEGEDSKTVFYVMPLIEGLSLRRIIDLRIEKNEVFTFKETLPLFNQLADGLSKLGRIRFHGVLAPESVVVLPDLLKITAIPNFHGLPRRPHVVKHEACGAEFYIAPEARSESGKPDGRADVYSLAVILTEMMTGRVYGKDGDAKWSGAREVLGANLSEVIRKAVSSDPAKRYDTVVGFVDAVFDQVDEADFPVVELKRMIQISSMTTRIILLMISSSMLLRLSHPLKLLWMSRATVRRPVNWKSVQMISRWIYPKHLTRQRKNFVKSRLCRL